MASEEKIFYFSYPLNDEGAPHQSMVSLWMAQKGVPVRYVAWGNEKKPYWLKNYPEITYYLLSKRGVLSALLVFVTLIREFWSKKFKFVYVQGAQQTPFLLWFPFFKKSTKLIYHTQDYLGPGQHWFYETCERFIARRADLVICNEPNRARFMASSYHLSRMPEIIRTALPKWWSVPSRDEAYRQDLLARADLAGCNNARLVVAGGSYDSGRMSPELVEAFSQLPDNYVLIFTGMIPDTPQYYTCQKHLQSLNLIQRVVLLKRLSYSDLLRLYSVCDIGALLYPNNGIGHFYQAPGRLTEYLRCGLQVVAADYPSLELLVLKYHIGSVADPYDATSIAQSIQQLGALSDHILDETRIRLKNLSSNEFAYEVQAQSVLVKFLNLEYTDPLIENTMD